MPFPFTIFEPPAPITPAGPSATQGEKKKVTLWCHAPGARKVFVAGTFNDWNPTATPMKRVGPNWKAQVWVVPGMHSYNFVIDDKWVCDPNRMEPGDQPCQMLISHWLG
jgi:5'-AMP-activated protein kinase regulatory beta subunit